MSLKISESAKRTSCCRTIDVICSMHTFKSMLLNTFPMTSYNTMHYIMCFFLFFYDLRLCDSLHKPSNLCLRMSEEVRGHWTPTGTEHTDRWMDGWNEFLNMRADIGFCLPVLS